jgi:hypothetical protein
VSDEIVRLTIVHDELEAELLCSRLREEGIECAHRQTDWSAAVGRGLPSGLPCEVVVQAADLAKAQRIVSEIEKSARRRGA